MVTIVADRITPMMKSTAYNTNDEINAHDTNDNLPPTTKTNPNNDTTEEAPPISCLRPSILNEIPKKRKKLEEKKRKKEKEKKK
ncbi:hypothetical protein C2G38_2170658 [Gigaspora rosea]|uniref:Uncharacterized protein n=1 Tax=Gigaspora rosea TaxID=44941 RepID=A0A397VMG2_9GLOM|nr:hypothetical protein C2G38_2170658 [Gigaspora rosea]